MAGTGGLTTARASDRRMGVEERKRVWGATMSRGRAERSRRVESREAMAEGGGSLFGGDAVAER